MHFQIKNMQILEKYLKIIFEKLTEGCILVFYIQILLF